MESQRVAPQTYVTVVVNTASTGSCLLLCICIFSPYLLGVYLSYSK